MLQKLRGVILAPRTLPGLCPAGLLFVGQRRTDAVKDTPKAVPAVMAATGAVIGAGVVCLKMGEALFHGAYLPEAGTEVNSTG